MFPSLTQNLSPTDNYLQYKKLVYFFPRQFHWWNKPHFREALLISRWPTKREHNGIVGFLCVIMLNEGILQFFFVSQFLEFWWNSLCASLFVSASLCVIYAFFIGSFTSVCFVFFLFLFYLIFFYYSFLDEYLFSIERQKGCWGKGWKGRWAGNSKNKGRGNYYQNILLK